MPSNASAHKPKRARNEKTILLEKNCWDLHTRGRNLRTIAAELGVTYPCVSRVLKRLRERFRAQLDEEIKVKYLDDIATHEKMFESSLISWEQDLIVGRDGSKTHNPAYLETAMRASKIIREIIRGKEMDDRIERNDQNPLDKIVAILDSARTRTNTVLFESDRD